MRGGGTKRGRGLTGGAVAVLALALVSPGAASATLPGANGDVLVAQRGEILAISPHHRPRLVADSYFRDASAAADGTVAWVDLDGGDPITGPRASLYIRSPGGEPRRLLTLTGFFFEVELMPDGSEVVFSTVSTTLDGTYALPVAGSEPRKLPFLTNDRHLEVSPDGRWIVFERYERLVTDEPGIWLMRTDGSRQRRILHFNRDYAEYPSFTPDGKRLVYRRLRPWLIDDDKPPRESIHSITLRGTRDRRLTPRNIRTRIAPFSSPNGKRVVYFLDGRLVTVSAKGGRERPFRAGSRPEAIPLDWLAR